MHPLANVQPSVVSQNGGMQRRQMRVLQLPPPNRSRPRYSTPLPNDCDGLIFAIKGNFSTSDYEMRADAATRILEALNERYDSIFSDNNGLWEPLTRTDTRKNRTAKGKVLETSWITSSYLIREVHTVIATLLDELEGWLGDKAQRASAPAAVGDEVPDRHVLTTEVLLTLLEVAARWLDIWLATGALRKPRSKEGVITRAEDAPKPLQPSSLTSELIRDEAVTPGPRGVGRPKAVIAPSIADFVDSIPNARPDLSTLRPAARPSVVFQTAHLYERVLELTQRMLCEELTTERSDKRVATSSASSLITEDTIGRSSAPVSALRDAALWNQALSAHVLHNPKLIENIQEAVKEAEYQAWRSTRRAQGTLDATITSQASSVDKEHGAKTSSHADVRDWHNELCIQQPHFLLLHKLLLSTLQSSLKLLEGGDIVFAAGGSLLSATCSFILQVWACVRESQEYKNKQLPLLFHCTGLGLLEAIIALSQEFQQVGVLRVGPKQTSVFETVRSDSTDAARRGSMESVESQPALDRRASLLKGECKDLEGMSVEAATILMLSFGRYALKKMLDEELPDLCAALDDAVQQLPGCYNDLIPVEAAAAKSAVIFTMVNLEDKMEQYPELLIAIAYVALACSAILARTRGLLLHPKYVSEFKDHAAVANASDLQLANQLLSYLPESIRERAQTSLQSSASAPNAFASQDEQSRLGQEVSETDDFEARLQSMPRGMTSMLATAHPSGQASPRTAENALSSMYDSMNPNDWSRAGNAKLTAVTPMAFLPQSSTVIDTYRESVNLTPNQSNLLDDLVFACALVLKSQIAESAAVRQYARRFLPVFRCIGVLSRSAPMCELVIELETVEQDARDSFKVPDQNEASSQDALPGYTLNESELVDEANPSTS